MQQTPDCAPVPPCCFCLFVFKKGVWNRQIDRSPKSELCVPPPSCPLPCINPPPHKGPCHGEALDARERELGLHPPPPSTSLLESQASRLQGPLGQPEKVVPRLITSLLPQGPDGGKEIAGSRLGQVYSQRLHGNWACLRGLGGVGGLNLAPRAHP